MDERQKIEKQLENIEERLAAAEQYVARNVNVEGSAFPHFGDWKGKSGHPLWMKNYMIPATKRGRARKEKALEKINGKIKEKGLRQRRRPRTAD